MKCLIVPSLYPINHNHAKKRQLKQKQQNTLQTSQVQTTTRAQINKAAFTAVVLCTITYFQ